MEIAIMCGAGEFDTDLNRRVAALLRARLGERQSHKWTLTEIMKWWDNSHYRCPLSEVELAERLLKFHEFASALPTPPREGE